MSSCYCVDHPLTVALGGFGNVGRTLAKQLDHGALPAVRLTAVAARDLERARTASLSLNTAPAVVSAGELAEHADVIVECATYDGFRDIVEPALKAGKRVIAVSVGALAENLDLIDLAEQTGGCLQVANGAMPGLDIVRCAAEGTIQSLTLRSHIRPESLARESYILEQGFDFSQPPDRPVEVFKGSARAAAAAFPRHFNVAVALSLAGVGLERTQVEIYADAGLPGARHTVIVESDLISLRLTSQNRPSPDNNRTSRIVAPSILAALRYLISPLQLGS